MRLLQGRLEMTFDYIAVVDKSSHVIILAQRNYLVYIRIPTTNVATFQHSTYVVQSVSQLGVDFYESAATPVLNMSPLQ